MKTKLPLYRQRSPQLKMTPESFGPMIMREVATMPGVGPIISVRAAKAHLSALLELVAGGREITITSDGKPKAVLSPVRKHKARKAFTGMGDYLMKQPVHRGLSADEAVNLDRDARGW
jgi:prevent-host-death family protein